MINFVTLCASVQLKSHVKPVAPLMQGYKVASHPHLRLIHATSYEILLYVWRKESSQFKRNKQTLQQRKTQQSLLVLPCCRRNKRHHHFKPAARYNNRLLNWQTFCSRPQPQWQKKKLRTGRARSSLFLLFFLFETSLQANHHRQVHLPRHLP